MPDLDLDMRVRLAAFRFLEGQRQIRGDVMPARVLWDGFNFEGQRVQLKGIQGIFKPAILPAMPLSVTTAAPDPSRPPPYPDGFDRITGTLLYHYRGEDPAHHENVGLRLALEQRRPLVYFLGVSKAEYFATWPVYIVAEERERRRFRILADDSLYLAKGADEVLENSEEARREYITATVRYRLHQQSFRARVLRAYREKCALCSLGHQQLLDAAHIVPDHDPLGEPRVSNGLALCKLHHAAFDQYFIGIRPDFVVEVRSDVLEERDGPMLVHGLQALQGRPIAVPRRSEDRPRPDYLEWRYAKFSATSPL